MSSFCVKFIFTIFANINLLNRLIMKAKRLILILSALICWFEISASNKNEVTPLFEGDSLVVLNEEQNILLDSAIGLLIENDSIVVLPQEISQMIGDTAKVCYLSYPDWQSAYFQKSKKNKSYLYVPTYAETPFGVIGSEIFIELEEKDSINCYVETILPIDNDKGMNTMYIASNIQGDFLRCKAYKKRDIRAHKLGINQKYFENERRARRDYSLSDSNMSPINRATKKNYDSTDMDKINKHNWTRINSWLNTKW